MLTTIKHTDAGRNREGFSHESSDCVVRALANAASIPYTYAHAFMKHRGRLDGEGILPSELEALHGLVIEGKELLVYPLGHSWEAAHGWITPLDTSITLFIDEHPIGSFMVHVQGHIFAVVDGVILDKMEETSTGNISDESIREFGLTRAVLTIVVVQPV